jgi:hydrogenase maturation factor HypF (carbamoyltransferase family)
MVIKETVQDTVEKEKLKEITCDICGKQIDLGKSMIGDLMDSNCAKVDICQHNKSGNVVSMTQFHVCNKCLDKFKDKYNNIKFIRL